MNGVTVDVFVGYIGIFSHACLFACTLLQLLELISTYR